MSSPNSQLKRLFLQSIWSCNMILLGKIVLWGIAATGTLSFAPSASFEQTRQLTNKAERTLLNQDTIIVEQFVPAITIGKVGLYKLSFHYALNTTQPIFISGVGRVPAKGVFSYLTPSKKLSFTNESGIILKEVILTRTGAPEAGGSKMPEPNEFPREYRSFTRPKNSIFSNNCDDILNKYFLSGYYPSTEKGITSYITTFQKISLQKSFHKIAEVSLLISLPYPVEGQTNLNAFRVHMVVRERGELATEWVTQASQITDATNRVANNFREQVISALQKPK